MSSSSFSHQFSCPSISSLLLLLLLFLVSSAAGFIVPGTKAAAARATNRGRRDQQSAEFLLAHNAARAASGVSSLKWDKGLARFASNWANQRKSDCKMTHSGGPHGENIFWYQKSENWSPKNVVAKWMAETSLNYDRTTNTCKAGQMCGHYTQIIWRTTTAVGCVRAKCDNDLGFLVICEYSPSGNYEGESPFDMPK